MNVPVALVQRLHWLGHATFRLDGPPTIYFDPWRLPAGAAPADVIFVSHEHNDHCSPEDIDKIAGPGTVIVANGSAAARLSGDVRVLQPGERLQIGALEVEAVPAYNVDKTFHPRQAGHNGYVVTLGGEILYFAGDTDRIPEMQAIRCDVALLPVSGKYTMTADEAAQAAADVRPRLAIPMHYGAGVAGSREDAVHFRSLCQCDVLILEQE